jgi:hypothetical protein
MNEQPYRVLVTGGGGAVMSLRFFADAEKAEEFVRGVMCGYWWRPVTLQDLRSGPAPKPPDYLVPARQTRLEVRWHDEVLISRSLQELTADHLKPLIELWRRRVA